MALHLLFTYGNGLKNSKNHLCQPFPAIAARPQRHFSGVQAIFSHTNRHQAHSNKA